jgi:hypothetical protein
MRGKVGDGSDMSLSYLRTRDVLPGLLLLLAPEVPVATISKLDASTGKIGLSEGLIDRSTGSEESREVLHVLSEEGETTTSVGKGCFDDKRLTLDSLKPAESSAKSAAATLMASSDTFSSDLSPASR